MFGRIYYGSDFHLSESDKSIFNHGNYICRTLLQTRQGAPVAVMQNVSDNIPVWKIVYGYSCIVFPTYEDAMAYCRNKFVGLDGKAV